MVNFTKGDRTLTKELAAILNQAAPIQDQWYEVVDIPRPGFLYESYIEVLTTGETLECRMTIDGTIYLLNAAQVAVAGTIYWIQIRAAHTNQIQTQTSHHSAYDREGMWFKTFKMEVRKTTAAGAGNLIGVAHYGEYAE